MGLRRPIPIENFDLLGMGDGNRRAVEILHPASDANAPSAQIGEREGGRILAGTSAAE
jgi:hypothetical protein